MAIAQHHGLTAEEVKLTKWRYEDVEQGFIDTWGVFHTREEAWKIASHHNQIIRRCGGDTVNGGRLYSENLY